MRLWIVYLFVSGLALFAGAALLLAATALPARRKSKTVRSARRVLILVGWTFIALSGTPLPLWFYALWAGLTLAWAIGGRFPAASKPKAVVALRLAAALATLAAVGLEIPRQIAPDVASARPETVYVVGDSISAGIDELPPWPAVLGRETGLRVINLAQGGAKARSAMDQADGIEAGPAVVVIEIGGNDMLGGTPAGQFEADLDRLIRALRGPERTLVMLELPIPPLHNRFGSAQRRVADRYGVSLVPKRLLAAVLTSPDGTTDGLHLSETGHARMAGIVAGLLR
ncbi:MAG TPA: GDSL-type esterase/lipase family protein [Phycisphaerae bacterium]|nr:GDSL-type esterase/lipase family protein [Phycisphaerae bacterium]